MQLGDILYDTFWDDKADNIVILEYVYIKDNIIVSKYDHDRVKSDNPKDYQMIILLEDNSTIDTTIEGSVVKVIEYYKTKISKLESKREKVLNK